MVPLKILKKEKINMEEKFSNDSFERQDYDEIKDMLNDLLLDLFKTMLDYKNVSYVNEENNFEYLDVLVRINYPQFSEDLIHLSVSRNEPNHSHLDIIKTMLSTYACLNKLYSDSEFEKRYLECNLNNSEDIIDDYD